MWRELIPPGADRERAVADIRGHFESLTGALGPAVEELRSIVAAHEPVELISSIVIPASMRFAGFHDAFSDATDTVTWAAKIEYLVGVALSVSPGAGSTPLAVSQRAMDLVSDVFDAVQAQQMLDSFDRPRGSNAALDEALFLLRMEHLFDRMPGYAVHLERIDAEIFDRHLDFYLGTIGFNPADVVRVVRRHNAAIQVRGDLAMEDARRLHNCDPDGSALAVASLLEALTDSRTWDPDVVARDTLIDAGQISLMLAFFSTTFGAQPEFRLPTDRNLARTNPAIDLGSGAYFVPDPWTLAAAVHDRLAQLASTGAQLQRYRGHREQGHQRLVANAFRAVFPDDVVTEGQHYVSDSDGAGEIDVLVAVEWPLIVEAKAHSLTQSGRPGAPARVERVASEVIEKALQQTRRAVTYVVDEGQRAFAAKQGAAIVDVLPDQIVGATEIIVTFERIDPLAMQGPAAVDQAGRSVWVVSIADFLMVADILNDPSELHHYARTRATNAVVGPIVYVESDGLGAYLADRLRPPPALPVDESKVLAVLGYSSDAINEYYTAAELGSVRPKPATGIPGDVSQALASVMTMNTGLWPLAVDAVMTAPPDAWRRWRQYRRRHRGRGRFPLTPNLHLVAADDRGLVSEDRVVILQIGAADSPVRTRR